MIIKYLIISFCSVLFSGCSSVQNNTPEHIVELLPLTQKTEELVPGNKNALGSQVILDLYDCQTTLLDDLVWVEEAMKEAARRAKGTIIKSVFHKFSPWGISGVVVISESHLAIHIWPEHKYAAIDIFTCSEDLGLKAAASYLIEQFQSKNPVYGGLRRGTKINFGKENS